MNMTNEPTFITGLTTDEIEPTNLEEVETTVAESLSKANYQPHNRAQRRAFAKKLGKSGRANMGTISETAKKLTYINLIEKIREMNKKEENENYEDLIEDS